MRYLQHLMAFTVTLHCPMIRLSTIRMAALQQRRQQTGFSSNNIVRASLAAGGGLLRLCRLCCSIKYPTSSYKIFIVAHIDCMHYFVIFYFVLLLSFFSKAAWTRLSQRCLVNLAACYSLKLHTCF